MRLVAVLFISSKRTTVDPTSKNCVMVRADRRPNLQYHSKVSNFHEGRRTTFVDALEILKNSGVDHDKFCIDMECATSATWSLRML